MKMKTIPRLAFGALLGITVSTAAGASLPAPPAGFTALPQGSSEAAIKARGLGDHIEAERQSDWSCKAAPKINFAYGWQALPNGDTVVEMMAKVPQDPPSESMGTKTEPAGKRRYKNGVLEWQKWTATMVQTDCPAQLVTYHGKWSGFVAGKLISVSVTHVKSQQAGQAWIDQYIDKVSNTVSGTK